MKIKNIQIAPFLMIGCLLVGCFSQEQAHNQPDKETQNTQPTPPKIRQTKKVASALQSLRPVLFTPMLEVRQDETFRSIRIKHTNGKIKREITLKRIEGKQGSKHSQRIKEIARFDNGNIREEKSFAQGRLHGAWKSWYRNGQLRFVHQFSEGKPHGLWRGWFSTGQPRSIGHYANGKQHGVWKRYMRTGRLLWKVRFDKGRRVRSPVPKLSP